MGKRQKEGESREETRECLFFPFHMVLVIFGGPGKENRDIIKIIGSN